MIKPKSLVGEHWAESALAFVLIVGTSVAWANQRITADAAVVIDVITATLAIYVAILKAYFAGTVDELASHQENRDSRTGEISAILQELNGPSFDYATQIIDSALKDIRSIPKGELRLQASDYYRELSSTLRRLRKGCHVSAVSSLVIDRWEKDPRQKNYFHENEAAVKRGVSIHRVFIIGASQINNEHAPLVKQVLMQHINAKIPVSVVWRESIMHDPELYDDFVMFNEEKLVFTDELEKMDPTRVLAGYKIWNSGKVQNYRDVFKSLTETYCIDKSSFDALIR